MSDDLKSKGSQGRSRIDVHEDHEVRYWTHKLGVRIEELKNAVQSAGLSTQAKELGKSI